ncbi:MAG: tRNA 2-thiouridine(34) synthase MnmA [Clostridiales bacterium]|nr:tRNA 2-thiouridine(34) synthase MnmA [Clostridiales bacterium]
MSKVIVGMSGGVDSAVAAYLLKEQGYEVIGVTLRVWDDNGEEGRCCEIDDARRSSQIIGIRYYPHNCTSLFGSCVVEPFVKAYLEGLTPNPCIECNRHVKWAKLMELMKVYEADYVATGHYAYVEKLPNGRYSARTADQASKDQTYMLYKLTQEQLAHTLMPLGKYTKDEVRDIARRAGLPCAGKEDSQEICFVTDGRYSDFIEEHASSTVPGEGSFVDEEGNVLGRHKGIHHYTVGQRKGLGIALGFPAYVTKIDPVRNEVVLGIESDLLSDSFTCRDVNFMSIEEPSEGTLVPCLVKARYHQKPVKATLETLSEGHVRVIPESPLKSVCPGQSAVFYDDKGYVIGGGIIDR